VQDLHISGTVVLEVQVTREGLVRNARVIEGLGHGCDRVASRALRGARFRPAVDTEGEPTDYELRYEYVFELEG
jgi:protein TonB